MHFDKILQFNSKFQKQAIIPFPNRQSVPPIVIIQEWDIFLDYEKDPCESDFEDYAAMFLEDYEAEE